MKPPSISGLVHVGLDILTTVVNASTKKILALTGDVTRESTDTDGVEWWQHYGFASRPPKPDAGRRAAQAVVLKTSDRDVAIASQDMRGLELYGALDHGEVCVYAAGEDGAAQGRFLIKKNGSINIFTKAGNASGGAGMGVFVNPDGSISISNPTGAAVLLGTDNSIKAFNANGAFQLAADGTVKVSSATKVGISAPAVVLGGGPTAAAVVTLTELTMLANAILTALATITPGSATTGGAPAVASLSAAMSGITAALNAKRTSAD